MGSGTCLQFRWGCRHRPWQETVASRRWEAVGRSWGEECHVHYQRASWCRTTFLFWEDRMSTCLLGEGNLVLHMGFHATSTQEGQEEWEDIAVSTETHCSWERSTCYLEIWSHSSDGKVTVFICGHRKIPLPFNFCRCFPNWKTSPYLGCKRCL